MILNLGKVQKIYFTVLKRFAEVFGKMFLFCIMATHFNPEGYYYYFYYYYCLNLTTVAILKGIYIEVC